MTAFLDTCSRGDVVYARNLNSMHGITTVARYDGYIDRMEDVVDQKTGEVVKDANGEVKQRLVRDYYLWDLRKSREMINPVACWKTAPQYQTLRSSGKIKLFGDYDEQQDEYSGPNNKKKKTDPGSN